MPTLSKLWGSPVDEWHKPAGLESAAPLVDGCFRTKTHAGPPSATTQEMAAWKKLVRFVDEQGHTRIGEPVDNSLDVGLALADGQPVEVYLIQGDIFDGTVTQEKSLVKKLLAPLSREDCSLIRCLGLNYLKHAQEAKLPIPTTPILFIKPRTALAGPGELRVSKAAQDDQLDYETELAVVIGKDARDVSESDALEYVLGYTASNDVSARKFQKHNSQWCMGKGFDQSCPIGPTLVRAHLLDSDNIAFEGKLSGQIMQKDTTADMIFNVKQAIAYLSTGTTLEKGTIIQMGTPSGIGAAREPKRWIQDGEEMRIWFDGIGTLINTFKFDQQTQRASL